jgi:D-arabinonate dehydratase/D-galactarolactone cycloisomerase
MKITSVEAFALQAPSADPKAYWGSRAWGKAASTAHREVSREYPTPYRRTFIYSKTIDTVLVRITTDEGLTGWGEAKAPVAPQVTRTVVELLLKDLLIGADPRDTTLLWERMFAGMRVRGHRTGFYMEAISGVDIALWDLAGQAAGVPLYQLMGGCFRNPVRIYASGLPALDAQAPDEAFAQLGEEADQIRRDGHTALKMALGRGLAGDIKSVRTVRDRLGPEFIIYADPAGVYDRAQALRLGKDLEELGVAWLEMPIFPEDVDGYVELSRALKIPIALDSLTSRYEARDLIVRGGIRIVQPDVCRAGGITECKRIAELADTFGLAFAPHISIGSAVHFVASAHLGSAMPNTMTCEYWIGNNPLGNAILKQSLRVADGYMHTPTGPGLGIEIRDDVVASFAEKVA